jgi:hypothetical protein
MIYKLFVLVLLLVILQKKMLDLIQQERFTRPTCYLSYFVNLYLYAVYFMTLSNADYVDQMTGYQ